MSREQVNRLKIVLAEEQKSNIRKWGELSYDTRGKSESKD